MRLLGIFVVLGIVGLLGWQILGNRVDRTNPDAVATAFIKALKGNNTKKASDFWVPETSSDWRTSAEAKVAGMKSVAHTDFFGSLPEAPVFVSSKTPKGLATEQTMTSGGTVVQLRQIDGKWYVCGSPL